MRSSRLFTFAVLFTIPLVVAAKPKKDAEFPTPSDVPTLDPSPTKPPTAEPAPTKPPAAPVNPPPVPSNLPDTLDPGPKPPAICATPATCPPGDVDADGIPDTWEDRLAAKFAPELHLPPDNQDWTRPATVDWYLARVHMRFEHNNCGDCQVLAVGAVTQANMATQSHRSKNWRCAHSDSRSKSSESAKFFLQPPNDDVHKGAPAAAWTTYVHVKRGAGGGYDVQYWFFYAYNDAFASANHEGDWEHITISTDAAGNFASAYYAQHEGGKTYKLGDLAWVQGTHPVVWVADGSHASYPREGLFDIAGAPLVTDHTYTGGPVWATWQDLINVGERGHPRNGQHFIDYGGRWGEFGETSFTTGPRTPSFQDAWNAL